MGEYKLVNPGTLLRGGVMPLVKYDPNGEYATPQNKWENALVPAEPYPAGTVLAFKFQGTNEAKEWASLFDSMNPDSNFASTLQESITEFGDEMLDLLNTILEEAGRDKVESLDDPVHFELVRERGINNSIKFASVLRYTSTLLEDTEMALPSLVILPEKTRVSGLLITAVYTLAPLRQDVPGTPPPAEPAESRIYDWAKDVF